MKVWVLVSLALLEWLRNYELQAPWHIYHILEDLKSCLRKQKLSLISKCKKMMRWRAARSRRSRRNTEFPYVQPLCEEQERSLVGLWRWRCMVSSSEPQTRRHDWSTLSVCWKVETLTRTVVSNNDWNKQKNQASLFRIRTVFFCLDLKQNLGYNAHVIRLSTVKKCDLIFES